MSILNTGLDRLRVIPDEDRQELPVIGACLRGIIVVEAIFQKLDVFPRRLRFYHQMIDMHGCCCSLGCSCVLPRIQYTLARRRYICNASYDTYPLWDDVLT